MYSKGEEIRTWTHIEQRPCEDIGRRWPSTSQWERPQISWSQTSSLRNFEAINFFSLSHSLMNHAMAIWALRQPLLAISGCPLLCLPFILLWTDLILYSLVFAPSLYLATWVLGIVGVLCHLGFWKCHPGLLLWLSSCPVFVSVLRDVQSHGCAPTTFPESHYSFTLNFEIKTKKSFLD